MSDSIENVRTSLDYYTIKNTIRIMARQKKEPETLETFTQKCMQRPMAKIIEELFNTRTELMECRRAIGGLKRRKESGVTKEEIQRLQNIERKYKKILGLAADVANADD